MVVIRLSRRGSKGRPFYNVVVANRQTARDGEPVERLGYYNPIANSKQIAIQLDIERFNYWKSQGAQVSATAASLVKKFLKSNSQVAAA